MGLSIQLSNRMTLSKTENTDTNRENGSIGRTKVMLLQWIPVPCRHC